MFIETVPNRTSPPAILLRDGQGAEADDQSEQLRPFATKKDARYQWVGYRWRNRESGPWTDRTVSRKGRPATSYCRIEVSKIRLGIGNAQSWRRRSYTRVAAAS